MSAISNSNRDSAMINALQGVEVDDPSKYSLSPSVPNFGMNVVKLAPESALNSTTAKDVQWKLPSNGFLVDGYLRVECSATSASGVTSSFKGPMNFEYFSVNSRDSEIMKVYPEILIHDLFANTNYNAAVNLNHAMGNRLAGSDAASTSNIINYVPLQAMPFAGSPKEALDTRFLEQLTLHAKARAAAATDARADASYVSADLYAKFNEYDDEAYRQHVNNNYKNQTKLQQRVSWTCYKESVVSQTSDAGVGAEESSTGNSWDAPGCITESYFMVKDLPSGTNTNLMALEPITQLVVNGNGRELLNLDNVEGFSLCMKQEGGNLYQHGVSITDNTITRTVNSTNILKVDWTMQGLGDDVRDKFSGGLSAGNLTSKTFDIFYTNTGDNAKEIHVIHKVQQLLSIDPRNGSVSVSARS